ncbi:Rieske (2Fe-2S) protein (plasmid) [Halorarum halophilum]|uniref:Rieske (2Fe-2S) protein n=1 Tax=Halorarum halophilum TaxID=2743090 RepID=A0A7D5KW62_9EURY|nr:Rieske (2Fe-2S) protein [Halobaculum halophilum]QLG29900.1 Rieske (2Fe-2S) protein [Halobaculum halophilum]
MATRQKIANADELPNNGDRIIAEVQGIEIAVFRFDGEYYALANYCVHQGGPLCEGALSGRTVAGDDGWEWAYDTDEKYVRCPWHGWIFDITDGRNVDSDRYVTPTYDIEVEDGEIFVHR